VSIDALQLRLATAQQRLATLERRASVEPAESKLLPRAIREIQALIADLHAAQDQLVEARRRVDELHEDLTRERQRYWELFELFPQASVVTGSDSSIVEANRAAAELFNVSQRYLVGKLLSTYVCEDRAGFLRTIDALPPGREPLEVRFRLRPRERAPVEVKAVVRADGTSLRWVVRPVVADAHVTALSSTV
jgi:PAS domain S-box-containing protein